MKLSIGPDRGHGARVFRIVYAFQATEEIRSYDLVPVDRTTGSYLIDEHNGIVLDALFAHETLISLFSVNERIFSVQYARTGNSMLVTMPNWKAESPRVSGDAGTPQVSSFGPGNLDRCQLTKTTAITKHQD